MLVTGQFKLLGRFLPRICASHMPKSRERRPKDHKCLDCDEELRAVTEFIIRALEKQGITAFAWDRPDLPFIDVPRAPLSRVN
jgi:hypothetical protein